MRKIFLIALLIHGLTFFGQSGRYYEKMAKQNKRFYRAQVDIWMKAYSYIFNIEEWNTKKMKVSVNPTEGVKLYTKEEFKVFSQYRKDSIEFSNNTTAIFEVIVPITLNNDKDTVFFFGLTPNGKLILYGGEFIIPFKENPPIYYRDKEKP